MANCLNCGNRVSANSKNTCVICKSSFCENCIKNSGRQKRNGGLKYICYNCKPSKEKSHQQFQQPPSQDQYGQQQYQQAPQRGQYPPPPPPPIDPAILHSLFNLTVPEYMEANSTHEIIINLHNTSGMVLNEIFADTSLFNEFFVVEGELKIQTLHPGMELEKRIRISPKYEKGVFPIKMRLHCGGAVIEKEYTIKVGGTEIY